jgi:hypothetical protein
MRRSFANFCHEIGCENDKTYIFRFVKYLSTFFYTYLPVNIHFQLIIITNVSILTDPSYFAPPSCHCGILALRSRDFWEITLREKHVFSLLWTSLSNTFSASKVVMEIDLPLSLASFIPCCNDCSVYRWCFRCESSLHWILYLGQGWFYMVFNYTF